MLIFGFSLGAPGAPGTCGANPVFPDVGGKDHVSQAKYAGC